MKKEKLKLKINEKYGMVKWYNETIKLWNSWL